MSAFKSSRVNETDPSPYDQVFLLSQAFINNAFQSMFPQPVSFSRKDREFLRTKTTGQWITAGQVSAPSISIHVEERNPAYSALFNLTFASGTIHLRTSPRGARDTFQNYPLDGWQLVFKTRIASKVLNNNDPKVTAYRTKLGFRDTVFELAQLYLDASDFGAGGGFDASRSNFKGATLSADTIDNLKLFVNEWLNSADARGLNVIGYSLTKHQTSSPPNWVGTFAPTIIDYAPYAWIDPAHPSVETDGLRQNALAMLTYTGSSRRSGYAPLGRRGPFVSDGAAFCMNRDLFWGRFVLPVLQALNQKTEVFPQKPKSYLEARCAVGKNPKHRNASDRYFGWKQQSSGGQAYWSWKGDTQRMGAKWPRQGVTQFAQSAQSSTQVTFTSGGQAIHVKGTITYNVRITSHKASYAEFRSEIHWDMPFLIRAISDGGIQVIPHGKLTVTPKKPKITIKRFQKPLISGLQGIFRYLSNQITGYLRTAISTISKPFASDLKQMHKLFLPGGGVFRFGTPLFNKRGDLLADLEYIRTPTISRLAVNRMAINDPSDKSETEADADTTFPDEEDLAAQFSRIALVSKEYPDDEEPGVDSDGEDMQSDDEELQEVARILCRLEDIGDHHDNYDSGDEEDFSGPYDDPLANTDEWFYFDRTDRTWPEEGDEDHGDVGSLPPDNEEGALDG